MNPDFANIRNIIFDLGNVLLNLDIEASIKAFQKLGVGSGFYYNEFKYSDPVFYEFETGKITAKVFRDRIRDLVYDQLVTDQIIDDAWCAMIKDIPANRVKVVQELKKHFNVYLFSNTNEIHINRVYSDFKAQNGINFSSLFMKVFYSYKINDRKPDLISFKKVIDLSAVSPEETLFVDDLEANILSAQKVGLRTSWLKKGMEMAEIFHPDVILKS